MSRTATISEFGFSLWPARLARVAPGRQEPAPKRQPFAKAGTPRQTERIRFFDVKHIKAELTIDTKKREVRGMVTHTLTPLHPYLDQDRARLRARAQGQQVTVGSKRDAVQIRRPRTASCR